MKSDKNTFTDVGRNLFHGKNFAIVGLLTAGLMIAISQYSGVMEFSKFDNSFITPQNAKSEWKPSSDNPHQQKLQATYAEKLDNLILLILEKGDKMSVEVFTNYLYRLSTGIRQLGEKPTYGSNPEIQAIISYIVFELEDAHSVLLDDTVTLKNVGQLTTVYFRNLYGEEPAEGVVAHFTNEFNAGRAATRDKLSKSIGCWGLATPTYLDYYDKAEKWLQQVGHSCNNDSLHQRRDPNTVMGSDVGNPGISIPPGGNKAACSGKLPTTSGVVATGKSAFSSGSEPNSVWKFGGGGSCTWYCERGYDRKGNDGCVLATDGGPGNGGPPVRPCDGLSSEQMVATKCLLVHSGGTEEGFGPSAAEVAKMISRSYDGSPASVRLIADELRKYGITASFIAYALGVSESEIQKVLESAGTNLEIPVCKAGNATIKSADGSNSCYFFWAEMRVLPTSIRNTVPGSNGGSGEIVCMLDGQIDWQATCPNMNKTKSCPAGVGTVNSSDGSNTCKFSWEGGLVGKIISVDGTGGGKITSTCGADGAWSIPQIVCENLPRLSCPGGSGTVNSANGKNTCSFSWGSAMAGDYQSLGGTGGGSISSTCGSDGTWSAPYIVCPDIQ